MRDHLANISFATWPPQSSPDQALSDSACQHLSTCQETMPGKRSMKLSVLIYSKDKATHRAYIGWQEGRDVVPVPESLIPPLTSRFYICKTLCAAPCPLTASPSAFHQQHPTDSTRTSTFNPSNHSECWSVHATTDCLRLDKPWE